MTLEKYLKINGISQQAFGDRIGVRQNTVSEWANGNRIPKRHHALKIINATMNSVTIADLWGKTFITQVLHPTMKKNSHKK